MPKVTASKKKAATRSRWAELAAETSFPVSALKVLEEHHATLNTFCANAYIPETQIDSEDGSHVSFELSFHQYCVALSALIQYGSPAQQYEYLHHTYAATSERGIDRSELLQLLKDHSEQVTNIVMKDDKLLHVTDPRHFDKLYTWLKKHFILYDESRSGFLPENLALEMLQIHPTALSHLKFQFAPFVKEVKVNNTRYADQAAAARHSD
ncbi:hypothetical protein PF005_g16251 [Phytophthora fragariae]|uniref:Uncharacterized protein n=1 Tax=Phytophthora fragariae TaxID=53985 RepID=A0A6A3EK59_9STRA|nr:hypothetical protein PF003_g15270 [Phytophthora fragariae]KAE8932291.1 hypothetical protein PF009_g17669 [Phytophthora fragariae]KAE9097692.1 hypothetical protein PF007_g16536 [Phytophthora fragariae]KAE9133379.1 hypothetical protein PF006_g15039 [Phytophthora fragariae]KAE9198132.1 hypothetical protein PF005_g16251 [Phytophthora fragariae]